MSIQPVYLSSPKLRRFYDYWSSKRVIGRFPSRGDIDPTEMPDLLPGITLIEVVRDPERGTRFRIRLFGTEHVRANRRDFTGLFVDEVFDGPEMEKLLPAYMSVAETGEPHFWKSRIPLAGREHYSYHRLLLPLADDGRTVDMLIGYYEFGPIERNGDER
jgi:hypothetical protein